VTRPVSARRLLQALGFLAGLALLVWCVSVALSDENRAQLERLGDASPAQVALLLACSAATMVLNGLIFWAVLWPVKRTSVLHMSAVNAAATLLSYAPFKIALAFRALVHQRIDRVPLLTIGAWFAAIGVLTVTVVAPALAASFAFESGSPAWWGGWIGGSAVCVALAVAIAAGFARDRGWARLEALLASVGLGFVLRRLGADYGRKIHAGVDMLAHPRASSAAGALRVADILVQAVRVRVAAEVLGLELGWGPAMVIASTYFLIGILSPIGMLGPREAGAAGVATLAGLSDATGAQSIMLVSVLVSATEALVNLAGGGLGAAYLRVDRWLLRRTADDDAP
jgi:hypothetical protein